MSLVDDVRRASRAELRQRILSGHPVDPSALEGWAYRGTSLGLPRLVERLSWKTFQKTFFRQPDTGRLVGWNVRLEQDGVDAPSRPKRRNGVPVTTWHYEVVSPDGVPMPRGFARGLVIDYGRGKNPTLDTIRFMKDPLVALEEGSADLLLGVTYAALGGWCVETPTYFLLEREHRVDFVPPQALASSPGESVTLLSFERRWAEVLFDAILPVPVTADRTAFWRYLSSATPPYFSPGLRAMVHALTFLPLTLAGFRRPFFALSEDARLACIERLGTDSRPGVRQLVATLKVLACFAAFEEPGLRKRVSGGSEVLR
ncbi:MAG: hypothetical protein AMXMBFR34_11980 [Myxococcaceae bacterium]